ncbi:unnamed protein product [Candidula unifasciata]|uniref:Uncharacterized protein n=1 Tax=Candidula unifasciata TaxID=100452 RepID=A0A8S3Z0N4_9EUPU|nr:unnamed protein product [Candidula unifasciata]
MRSLVIYLSLFVITILLSGHFWDWYRYRVDTFKMECACNKSSGKTAEDIGIVATYKVDSTDSIPSVCEFPRVDPFEPSVVKIAGVDKQTATCEGMYLSDLTYIDGHTLKVNTSMVEDYLNVSDFQHCKYRSIFRHITNDNSFKYGEWSKPFKDKVDLPKDAEFLKVECMKNTSELISKTFYYLVPRHEELEEFDLLNLKKRQAMSLPKETLNVIMIGLDTLPRHQLIRACNKTYSYLMNSFKSFDLTLHSQVGLNTFPNFLPLFGGLSYDEIAKWWSDKYYLDNIDLLWGTFEKAGYRTLYTEDFPGIGAFNYQRKGFRFPFARYNTRPLILAIYDDKDLMKQRWWYCYGNQPEMKFLLNYVSKFLDTFSDKPVFAVAMLSKPSHDHVNEVKMIDEYVYNFYHYLNQKGHMNRSLVISFSDHGVRWGPLRNAKNGNFDSRTPYTILTFPDWFLKKYPDVAANLEVNSRRLTSHFDTHATLLDLLYFKSNLTPQVASLRHGISLFEKIPWDRTCKDASIPLEYCMCGYTGLEELNITSNMSMTLSNLVVKAINSKTDKKACAVFELHHIIRVLKISITDTNSKKERTIFKVKLETTPGNVMFEANVYADDSTRDLKVGNDINRLNLYKGQADCVSNALLRPFCYCKRLPAK